MSDFERLRIWLSRAAPRRVDLIKALFFASIASLAGTGLFVGALGLLVVSAQRPGLRALAAFLILLELVAFLRSPLRFGERMATHRLGFAAVARWRQWLMGTVGNWSYSRWQRFGAGDLLERSLTDTEELQDLWLRGVIPSVATLITLMVSDIAVALLAPRGHWWVAATAMAIVQFSIVALLVGRLGAQVRADRQLRICRGAYVASLVSSRAAAPEIERLGATEFLRRRDETVVARLQRAEDVVRRVRQRDVVAVVLGPLACLVIVAAAHPRSAGVWLVVAALVALTTSEALVTVRTAVHVAVSVTGGAERLDELSSPPERAASPWPTDWTMTFNDVVVSANVHGVHLVSGTIAPGRRVAVNGPSGSGKSTLLRALARLDDIDTGTVTLGSVDLNDIAEGDLRQHVVLVPSEPGLFHGFVRDVVGMGVALSDADLAPLHQLGINVARNDHWEELSRGERQRVALVRAIVRQPDILLLDEPTSALGSLEVDAVLEVLSRLTSTVIIASHDARVISWCDEVISLDDHVAS